MLFQDNKNHFITIEIREGERAGKTVYKVYINGKLLHTYNRVEKAHRKITEYIRLNDWRRL